MINYPEEAKAIVAEHSNWSLSTWYDQHWWWAALHNKDTMQAEPEVYHAPVAQGWGYTEEVAIVYAVNVALGNVKPWYKRPEGYYQGEGQ